MKPPRLNETMMKKIRENSLRFRRLRKSFLAATLAHRRGLTMCATVSTFRTDDGKRAAVAGWKSYLSGKSQIMIEDEAERWARRKVDGY